MNIENVLCDNFVDFSKRICEIIEKKKQISAELKLLVQKSQKEITDLNEEAAKLIKQFEESTK